MSLEQKIEQLTEAVTMLTTVMSHEISKVEKPVPAKPKAEKPKADNKDKELQAEVKFKAGELMKVCGKDSLTALLSQFGAKKVSDLKAGGGVFKDFIARAEELLSAPPVAVEEDLLDESPAVPEKKKENVTMDDVKNAIKSVMDHPDLGKNFALAIVNDLGAQRIGDLKASQYQSVVDAATEEIAKVTK